MAISSTTNRETYLGDGTSASFSFAYEFHSPSDLVVYLWNSSRVGVDSLQTITTDYVISGTKDAQNRYRNGGTVIFNSTPAIGDHIVIYRDTAENQPFNLRFNQVLPTPELIKGIDRISLVEQRLADLASRSVGLVDSYPLTFDPSLPNTIPKNVPVIVNSNANGMTFGIVSMVASTVASLIGLLPVDFGGTEANFSGLNGLVYSPGSSTPFREIPQADKDNVLISNNSAAPSFGKVSAAHIGSGIIGVSYGGTGTGTSYIPYGVVFASSATQFADTAAGGADIPLLGNGQAAPGFRALPVNSASSVTGIMRQINGGTGTASSFQQYSLIMQGGADHYSQVAPAGAGLALITNASSAPSYQAIAQATPVAPTNVSANYIVSTTDGTLILGSSNYSLYLYGASGNTGREIKWYKEENTPSSPIIIICSGTEGVIGVGSTFNIYTKGEAGTLFSDGSNWRLKDHRTQTEEFDAGAIVIQASTTSPTKGTVDLDAFKWKRDGSFVEWRYSVSFAAGTVGNGDYEFVLPSYLPIDTNTVVVNSGVYGGSYITTPVEFLGHGWVNHEGGAVVGAHMYAFTSQLMKMILSGYGVMGSAVLPLNTAKTWGISGRYQVQGWVE